MYNSFMNNIIKIGLIFNFFINEAVNARVTTKYTNGLYSYSSTFVRPNGYTKNYYFHAIKVKVFTTGLYSFTSNSTFDTYGSIHHYPVELTNLSKSMIAYNDDSGGGGLQFQINLTLQSDKAYVLLVTTYSSNVTGLFTIIVEGPTNVELIQNDYFVLESTTTTTISPMITSTYLGILSSYSLKFSRPSYSPYNYYYQASKITTTMSGTYSFVSNSSIDTYGYFYDGSFNPSNPNLNLIASNDDGGDNNQFRINVTLQFQCKYILVVTTYNSNITGSFSIEAVGPSRVYFYSITSTTDQYQLCNSYTPLYPNKSSVKKIIVIVIPILIVLIIIIIGCCISRCNRKRMSRHHQNAQTGILSITNTQRIEIAVPYTISLTRTSDRFEEQPPSYESVISSMRIQR
ncbi:unnamed protein product [Adineta steineri]|uniref:Uncharacterized protein n=2 Tax=Adineta steineri TaxID=433720 RepID=A0A814NPV0_9BILA|nr:unnamed protein product [Adineta steineri]